MVDKFYNNKPFGAPAASEWAPPEAAEPSQKVKINSLDPSLEPIRHNWLHQLALGVRLASQFPIQVDAGEGPGEGWPPKVGPQMATLGCYGVKNWRPRRRKHRNTRRF